MTEFLHILDRFIIHATAATALVLWTFMLLRTLQRRAAHQWLPSGWRQTLVIAALAVFAVATLREGYDIRNGQSAVKEVFDYISWLIGGGFGAWSLYRFKHETD